MFNSARQDYAKPSELERSDPHPRVGYQTESAKNISRDGSCAVIAIRPHQHVFDVDDEMYIFHVSSM